MNTHPSYQKSFIAVAEMVIKGLENGKPSTVSVAATLPKMVAELRTFGRDDLANRLAKFL